MLLNDKEFNGYKESASNKGSKKKENFVLTSCSHSSDDGSDHPLVILRYDLNFVLRVFLYIRQYESAF